MSGFGYALGLGHMASSSALSVLFGRSGKHFPCRNAAVGRKRKGCKARVKGCKRGLHPEGTYADTVSSGVCFSFVSPGVLIGEGRLTWSGMGVPAGFLEDRALLLIYTPVFAG